jgi:hypothetical protein
VFIAAARGSRVGISGRLLLCKAQKQSALRSVTGLIRAGPRGSGRGALPGLQGPRNPRGWRFLSLPW